MRCHYRVWTLRKIRPTRFTTANVHVFARRRAVAPPGLLQMSCEEGGGRWRKGAPRM